MPHVHAPPPQLSAWQLAALCSVVFAIGAAVLVQTGVNATLGRNLATYGPRGVYAVAITFTEATLLLCGVVGVRRWHAKKSKLRVWRAAYSWKRVEFISGVLGAAFVVISTLLTPIIGFAVYFVLYVAGQMTVSMIVDHVGFMGLPVSPASGIKLIAVLLALAGAVCSCVERFLSGSVSDVSPGVFIGLAATAILSGVLLPVQAAFNVQLARRLRGALYGTCMSFIAGSVALIVLSVCLLLGLQQEFQDLGLRWWHFMGGFLGIIYVGASIQCSRLIGVARFFMLGVAGQLTLSLVFDAVGAFGVPINPPTVLRVIGVVIVLLAAVLMQRAKMVAAAAALSTTPQPPVASGAQGSTEDLLDEAWSDSDDTPSPDDANSSRRDLIDQRAPGTDPIPIIVAQVISIQALDTVPAAPPPPAPSAPPVDVEAGISAGAADTAAADESSHAELLWDASALEPIPRSVAEGMQVHDAEGTTTAPPPADGQENNPPAVEERQASTVDTTQTNMV